MKELCSHMEIWDEPRLLSQYPCNLTVLWLKQNRGTYWNRGAYWNGSTNLMDMLIDKNQSWGGAY